VGGANGQLLFLCNNAGGTLLNGVGNPAGTTALASNLNNAGAAGSLFQLLNPSASGIANVVRIRLVGNAPVKTVETEAALGATPKR
jgi:hypothetical protein